MTGDRRDELLQTARAGWRRSPAPAPGLLAMPRAVPDFTGRKQEMDRLASLADGSPDGPAPIVVISGPPGVGKTSLAVHAATELSCRFPDGHFFVDLRGLEAQPTDPGAVLDTPLADGDSASGQMLPVMEGSRHAELRGALWKALSPRAPN
ncbi:AAA family ATPase [Streptomyces sp. NPDC018972]|uniref:AAA family ATPase n=1 Tax=Streptomyces sp. NPDC018972 TaxID=3365060 RepID=UPI00378E142E